METSASGLALDKSSVIFEGSEDTATNGLAKATDTKKPTKVTGSVIKIRITAPKVKVKARVSLMTLASKQLMPLENWPLKNGRKLSAREIMHGWW